MRDTRQGVPVIRSEQPEDIEAITRINDAAFNGPGEGKLVGLLRDAGALTLSLVAELDGQLVGHIAFSEVTAGPHRGLGLAPVAVLPSHQRRGVGSELIKRGLLEATQRGWKFCVLVGHPSYYARFGFEPGARHSLAWDVPGHDDAFMVKALVPRGLDGVSGLVSYRPEFRSL